MSQSATLLVIDDEPQIRKFLRISLASQGYKVLEAATGAEGLAQAALGKPDLVVLDLGLPDMDGQQVLRELREWSAVPVMVLSVRASEVQKVDALDGGANDYVTKPFGIQEFLARVRALLRQVPQAGGSEVAASFGPLTVDFAFRRVTLEGVEVALTRKEYALLALLAGHPGRVITQQQLLKDIWGRPMRRIPTTCASWSGICDRSWAMTPRRRGSSLPRRGWLQVGSADSITLPKAIACRAWTCARVSGPGGSFSNSWRMTSR